MKTVLSHQGYIEKVLDKFGMSKAKPMSTQLANHFKLSLEWCPKTDREIEDLAKVPSRHHWETVKWIFRYSKVLLGMELFWAISNPLVVGYVNSDYVGDLDDERSITGYVCTLGGRPICWKSTVQSIVALSTTEAKHMAVAEAAKEAYGLMGYQRNLVLCKVEFSCTMTVKVQFI
ncbi:UNVERIFIED_CONTAM: Retrovirus-related Pol polyprotein from transposon TNT 1-94 [Sesamum calycinum]|uniref:Retrovirus-related Pol polyprotein from transposon TNT 1-94 n=1 Tax=Sesamum calycinum TaxID=2727403 RepID=A0AAW2MQ22_9LAMI